MKQTYCDHLMAQLRAICKHINGLLELAHGFTEYYKIQGTHYTADSMVCEIVDTVDNQVYTVEIKPKRDQDSVRYLPEKF